MKRKKCGCGVTVRKSSRWGDSVVASVAQGVRRTRRLCSHHHHHHHRCYNRLRSHWTTTGTGTTPQHTVQPRRGLETHRTTREAISARETQSASQPAPPHRAREGDGDTVISAARGRPVHFSDDDDDVLITSRGVYQFRLGLRCCITATRLCCVYEVQHCRGVHNSNTRYSFGRTGASLSHSASCLILHEILQRLGL